LYYINIHVDKLYIW